MIISINGWPGTGKLTVALELADRINARLLDNHSIFNVAIALTEYGTPAYYAAARAVRDIAFKQVLALEPGISVILTNVIATGGPSEFAHEHWQSIRNLAETRRTPLVSIMLNCDPAEQARRIVSIERRARQKMRDLHAIDNLRKTRRLFDDGADYRYTTDNSRTTAARCADEIADWLLVNVPSP